MDCITSINVHLAELEHRKGNGATYTIDSTRAPSLVSLYMNQEKGWLASVHCPANIE